MISLISCPLLSVFWIPYNTMRHHYDIIILSSIVVLSIGVYTGIYVYRMKTTASYYVVSPTFKKLSYIPPVIISILSKSHDLDLNTHVWVCLITWLWYYYNSLTFCWVARVLSSSSYTGAGVPWCCSPDDTRGDSRSLGSQSSNDGCWDDLWFRSDRG